MAGPGKCAIEGQNEASSSRVGTGLSTVNSTASSIKRGRSRTRNIALSRRRNANEKLLIEIPEEVNRIVGVNSQFAITEAGCLTRRFAPLQVTKWAKIDEDKKQALLRDFKGSFNSGESLRCDDVIFSQMKTHYRNYRHMLYKNFFQIVILWVQLNCTNQLDIKYMRKGLKKGVGLVKLQKKIT